MLLSLRFAEARVRRVALRGRVRWSNWLGLSSPTLCSCLRRLCCSQVRCSVASWGGEDSRAEPPSNFDLPLDRRSAGSNLRKFCSSLLSPCETHTQKDWCRHQAVKRYNKPQTSEHPHPSPVPCSSRRLPSLAPSRSSMIRRKQATGRLAGRPYFDKQTNGRGLRADTEADPAVPYYARKEKSWCRKAIVEFPGSPPLQHPEPVSSLPLQTGKASWRSVRNFVGGS